MADSPPLSGVNVVLVMAYGSLVFVLLFIFVKRQIMRFAMRSRRGPHAPIGHNAPKGLREQIDSRLLKVHEIRFEPRLLPENDARLRRGSQLSEFLQALASILKEASEMCSSPSAFTGRRFRSWLLELRNSHSLIKSSRGTLIDRLLEGYDSARHGTGVFGEAEFLEYQQALSELADVVKAYWSSSTLEQQHQSAAKDLTGSPACNAPSTIQVTYLPSTGPRSKRPKHFLELKSFKDNYNTLESTL
uniref:Chromosome 1 open reading frame 43 n=1 Tax=Hippocampus comes TaxID=109280 RepID=A0A3Q2XDG2_HIPCM